MSIRGRQLLAPSEIFERCCEKYGPLVGLQTVVLVEAVDGASPQRLDGPARMMGWRGNGVDLDAQQFAEDSAWAEFAVHWDPAELEVLPGVPVSAKQAEHVVVVPLPLPLYGILRFETALPLTAREHGLLAEMTAQLSMGLAQLRLQED